MPFDLAPDLASRDAGIARRHRGLTSYHAGRAAEMQVAQAYARRGHAFVASRWRGRCGELDLIFRDGGAFVFVEVKRGPTHDRAAERLSRRQIARIFAAADEFLDSTPRGALTERRIDVALVDAHGVVDIRENALAWL